MLAEIAAAASTLKAMGDAAKTIKDLSAAQALDAKIGELLGQITTARESALASQARTSAKSSGASRLQPGRCGLTT